MNILDIKLSGIVLKEYGSLKRILPTYELPDIIARHFGSLRMDWRNGKYEVRPLKKETVFKNLAIDDDLLASFDNVTKEYNRIFGNV